jgi:hypothetical protein
VRVTIFTPGVEGDNDRLVMESDRVDMSEVTVEVVLLGVVMLAAVPVYILGSPPVMEVTCWVALEVLERVIVVMAMAWVAAGSVWVLGLVLLV